MTNHMRKWLAASMLLATSGLTVWGLAAPPSGSVAQAASPNTGIQWGAPSQVRPGTQQDNPIRRESLPPTDRGIPPLTGPASLFEPLLTPIFGENYRANTDTQSPNRAQQEPSIAVNPMNAANVVVAAKDERAGANTKHVWIYTSTDAGVTWLNQIFPYASGPSAYSSDPVVNFSDDGICYVTSLPYGSGPAPGIQVARSTDGGITFSPGVHLPGTTNNSDKEWTWIDNFPSSPYYHRLYTAWMDFGSGSVWRVNYSSDRGQTWSQPSAPYSAYQFPMPVVLPNGDVLVTYLAAADALAYARSTDGGVTFPARQIIGGIIRPYCPPDNAGCSIWRLNAIPSTGVNPTNGNIVIVWADGNGNRATIYYTRSTDNGATWSPSAPLAVSPIPGTYQVEPWVEADEQGTFHAIWYDDRENPNTSIFHIYYSQSTNNGATWSPAVRISTAASDLRIGIPSSYNLAAGDYIQVTASRGNVYAAWTDTRSGTGEDIYVVRGVEPVTSTVTPMVTSTRTVIPTSTLTRTPVPPSGTATPTACGGAANYVFATATATMVPGTLDIGNHCDDCFTQLTLPFPVRLYDQAFTQVGLESNGKAHFPSGGSAFPISCFPIPAATYVIVPYYDDLRTDTACPMGPCGIYTSISGSAPNRIFNIEWRTIYFTGGGSAHFELRLYEDQSQGFDVIYDLVTQGTSSALAGVQRDSTRYTQYACNGQGGDVSNGRLVMYDLPPCGTGTPTAMPSSTPPPSPTSPATLTATSPANNTPTNAPTNTVAVASPTSTTCSVTFSDVPSNHTFYANIMCLACRGIISGYADGTFRPDNLVTRSQLAKIVSNAAGLTDDPGPQIFQDVASGHPFHDWINRLARRGYMSGYACGSPGEPCINNRPYFRPYANATRAQTAKIVSNAAMIETPIPPTQQTFEDVPSSHPFWIWIERLAARGVMGGYNCGGPGEPCIPPGNRAYFRPYNDVTRGQSAKIVANTFFPDCYVP